MHSRRVRSRIRNRGARLLGLALGWLLCAASAPLAQDAAAVSSAVSSEERLLAFFERVEYLVDRDTSAALAEARALRREAEARGDQDALAVALATEAEIIAITEGPVAAGELFAQAEAATRADSRYPTIALELARFELSAHAADDLRNLEAVAHLKTLVEDLPPSSLSVYANTVRLAAIYDSSEAEALLAELRVDCVEAGVHWFDAWLDYHQHELLWFDGSVSESKRVLARVLERAAATDDLRLAGNSHYSFAWMHWEDGEYDEALADIDRSLELVTELGDRDGQGRALELKACILREAGQLEQALQSARAALEVIEGRGYLDLQAEAYSTAADIAGILGDGEATLEFTRGFGEVASLLGSAEDAAAIRRMYADLERAEEQRARAELEAALEAERNRAQVRRQVGLTLVVVLIATALLAAALYVGRRKLERSNERLRAEMQAAREAEEARQQLEERMRQIERLEGLGLIAGGIAHDFNNLLVGVLGNVELLQNSDELSESSLEYTTRINESALRASQLCQRLLSYSGRQPVEHEALDLEQLVQRMLPVLRSAVSLNAHLEVERGMAPTQVLGDATQIEQVLLNLITNARDAGSSRIHIRMDGVELSRDELLALKHGADVQPGRFVLLEVEDDGEGMQPAVLEHLFDPFFTTRFPGRGLGMAALFGIVRSHAGAIATQSEPGQGTTMRIYLPASREPAAAPAPRAPAADGEPSERFRGVLVVDDEPMVQQVVVSFLQRLALDAVSVPSAGAALEEAERRGAGIDLVLLDETMPDLGGHEIIGELRSRLPHAPIVLMSGHSREELQACCGDQVPDAWLSKPFTQESLRAALSQAQTGRQAANPLSGIS